MKLTIRIRKSHAAALAIRNRREAERRSAAIRSAVGRALTREGIVVASLSDWEPWNIQWIRERHVIYIAAVRMSREDLIAFGPSRMFVLDQASAMTVGRWSAVKLFKVRYHFDPPAAEDVVLAMSWRALARAIWRKLT